MRLGVSAALVDGVVVPGDVEVDGSTVAAAGLGAGRGTGLAVPGFVDLQVNGFAGVEFRAADPGGYGRAAAALAAGGAVAIQPTFYSCDLDGYTTALEALAEVRAAPPVGCTFLPAHLEGPFLSPVWAGAHRPESFLAPDRAVVDRLLRAGPVGCMTVAPELPGALAVVRALVSAGVIASIGHSDATAAQVRAAVDAGARHLTHCWNAHRRFVARDPGPAGVALTDPRLTVGLIVDLVHVAAETVLLTMAAARGRVAATGDTVAEAPGSPGRAARLGDGTLAGGLAGPDELLRNLVDCGVDLAEAVDACGGAQRRLLGSPEVRVRPGDPADLVVLDDGLRPRRTLVGGREVWAATA